MSDLVLSNLTIQGHQVGIFIEPPVPQDEVQIDTLNLKSKNLTIDDGGDGITLYNS